MDFEAGDLVLIYKPLRKVGLAEKLLHRWMGPYRVLRQTTPVNYEVQLSDGSSRPDIVHVVRMKKFHEREEETGQANAHNTQEETRAETTTRETEKRKKGRPKKAKAGKSHQAAQLGDAVAERKRQQPGRPHQPAGGHSKEADQGKQR